MWTKGYHSSGATLWVQLAAKTLKAFVFNVANVFANADLSRCSCIQVHADAGVSL